MARADRRRAEGPAHGRAPAAVLLAAAALGAVGCSERGEARGRTPAATSATAPSAPRPEPGPPPAEPGARRSGRTPPAGAARWLAFGGGAEPSTNQVSLEQDLALAGSTFGGGGVLLYAGGPDAPIVQELAPEPRAESLLARLGELFDPRAGRDARYRPTRLAPDGPATLEAVERALDEALGAATDLPLLVYAAAHGDVGEAARDDAVILWGGHALTVADLAARLGRDASRRRVRLLLASCYSGGFADIAFRDARADQGATPQDRCGLFAAPWDQESSGCDPDPDRRVQESYSLHVLQALAGRDRDGARLPLGALDLDGDGTVSLLEAHTRARIAARSIDLPTTTSERWLRQVAPASGAELDVALPEEDAVIRELGRGLGLRDARAAEARLALLQARRGEADAASETAEQEAEERAADLRVALLTRWPVLDDAWHPDFAAMVARDQAAIAEALDRSPEARAWRVAGEDAGRAAERAERLELEQTRVARLVRAHETRTLARRLRAAGGEAWERYARFLACERSAP